MIRPVSRRVAFPSVRSATRVRGRGRDHPAAASDMTHVHLRGDPIPDRSRVVYLVGLAPDEQRAS